MRVSTLRTVLLAGRGAADYVLHRPYCVSFEVTHACNGSCRHCHLGGAVDETRAPPETYGRLARELKPLVAQVSGGEPLLRRDLEQIIRSISDPRAAPYIVVTTNAALLSEDRFFSLREAGVDEFSVSLDYPDKRHNAFRGIPKLYERIESLVCSLPAQDVRVITLACVVQSDNFRDLVRLAELARAWNVRLNFSTYTPLRTDDKGYMVPAAELEELQQVIRRLLDFREAYGVIHTSEYVFGRMVEFFKQGYVPSCRTGTRFLVVNPDGTLSPCGLVLREYSSRKELRDSFSKGNTCGQCYTSIRANSEKPLKNLVWDSLRQLRSR